MILMAQILALVSCLVPFVICNFLLALFVDRRGSKHNMTHQIPGTLELHDAELATQSSDALHPMNLKPRRVLVAERQLPRSDLMRFVQLSR